MAYAPDTNVEVLRTLASTTLVAATPQTSSFVNCRGAKSVTFIVRSTTAGETDAFTAPSLSIKAASDQGAAGTLTAANAAASNAYGIIAPNGAACVTAGNVGFAWTVYPQGIAAATYPMTNARLAIDSIAITLGPHATNDISTVVVDTIVVWN